MKKTVTQLKSSQTQIERLLTIMQQLRDPESGCPWDAKQTFSSIAPYTIEEAYEVDDAIRQQDMPALVDELGDLLFQVVFHSQIAAEAGHFDFSDVVTAISDKMERRHPHVFSDTVFVDENAQKTAWEDIKATERQVKHSAVPSALDGVPTAMPALSRASKLGKRTSRVGFDWPDTVGVKAKIAEELAEVDAAIAAGDLQAVSDEIGDVLFAVTNLARHCKVDPERALRETNHRFEGRFRQVEKYLLAANKTPQDASLDELEALWQQAKRELGAQ